MKYRYGTLLAAAFAALWLASDAQAAFVNWSYNWSRVPSDVISADAFGTSRISLTDEPLGRATNSSDIVATNIRIFSDAKRATPNSFLDAAYALTLRITDDASGESGTVNFSGTFSGTASATSADISTTITSATQHELVLGGHRYIVSLDSYSPPGPPGINNAGSLSAAVEVVPKEVDPPPPPPNDVPEPSTMLLSALGLSMFGMASWRKWKAARA